MTAIPCVRCKRWKLFGESPCAEHPDFKTAKDISDEKEAAEWAKANDAINVLMFTSALRTAAAMGRTDLLDNAFANLQRMPESVQDEVAKELETRGVMTSEEMVDSWMAYLALHRRTT